ncbi:MAG TPA: oligosaccharide flippase family protein [Candidatus Omnitrophota bacterium]|nr:oligosaccharide flippase family protein [Candidatus Omnitrophota bacterium]HPD85180.1 oligosaccharide flippase family protein [Candidatus Omnitrophota bacterium]HRZ04319.1 oligosaccharide flippase family protein [Candidatus Omnitrophota bacterium]
MVRRGKRIISGFLFKAANTILSIVIAFFMMPFILHALGDRMYGLWILVGVFMGYMGYLDFGVSQAVSRYIAGAIGKDDPDELNEIANTAFIIYLTVGMVTLLVTVIIIAVSGLFVRSASDLHTIRILIFLTGVSLAVGFPARAFGGVLGAHLRYTISGSLNLTELLLRNLLIVIFFSLGYRIIALGIIVFSVTMFVDFLHVFFAFRVEKRLRIDRRYFKINRVRQLFSYSFYVFISKLAEILLFRVDSFVITIFVGLTAVTHYSIAATLIAYYSQFIFNSIGLIGPVFSQDEGRGDIQEIRRKFFLTTKISMYIAVFIGVMILFYGKPFIIRWMGINYVDAYSVLVVLVPASLFALMQLPSGSLLLAISKHKFMAVASVLEGIFNLLLSIIFVQKYGIVGVAMGTAIPMLVTRLLIQPVYVCKVLKISKKYYYINILMRCIAVAVLGLVPVFLLFRNFVTPEYFKIFISGAFHFVFYAGIVYLFGFKLNERDYLMSYVKITHDKM